MTPERMADLVARWVRFYTRGLPAPTARRRIDEIGADLHDHIAHERAHGTGERRIALGLLSRMVRGAAADALWRGDHASPRTAYRCAVALGIATTLMLVWVVGAVGVIGEEGDRADMMYGGVLAVGILGTLAARLRPAGMARALLAMAVAQGLVAVAALIGGEHHSPVTSVGEILGVNAFFAALFGASAWLFRRSVRRPARAAPPG